MKNINNEAVLENNELLANNSVDSEPNRNFVNKEIVPNKKEQIIIQNSNVKIFDSKRCCDKNNNKKYYNFNWQSLCKLIASKIVKIAIGGGPLVAFTIVLTYFAKRKLNK